MERKKEPLNRLAGESEGTFDRDYVIFMNVKLNEGANEKMAGFNDV